MPCKKLTEVVGEHGRVLDDVDGRVTEHQKRGAGLALLEATGAGRLLSVAERAVVLLVDVVPENARERCATRSAYFLSSPWWNGWRMFT